MQSIPAPLIKNVAVIIKNSLLNNAAVFCQNEKIVWVGATLRPYYWNEYVTRYHPLGYKQPFGYRMRYFIVCELGKLGCMLFSGAAKELGARNRWIGWTDEQRLQRLTLVVNNSRHLVFPWVQAGT